MFVVKTKIIQIFFVRPSLDLASPAAKSILRDCLILTMGEATVRTEHCPYCCLVKLKTH